MITITRIKLVGVFAELTNDFIVFKQKQEHKYYTDSKILRHFCNSPKSMKRGEDLTAMLLALSEFMGHISFDATSLISI